MKFPSNDNDTTRTKVGFHSIAGFPNVLGAKHIQIATPNADELCTFVGKGIIQLMSRHSLMKT